MISHLAEQFTIFSIDPSNTSCGWAVLEGSRIEGLVEYKDSGTVRTTDALLKQHYDWFSDAEVLDPVQGNLNKELHPANDWMHKNWCMVDALSAILDDNYERHFDYDSCVVLIELPWGAGVRNVDDIMKLMCLVGMLRQFFIADMHVQLCPVIAWKGQAKKGINLKRVNRRWGLELQKKDYDEADAIGIATWWACEIHKLKAVK